jgi:hypothetical protein
VLQHAAQEADRLLHDYVATEHLLLGLLSEQGSVAADVLTARGLRLDRVREQIVELLSDGVRLEHPGPPGIPANTFEWPWLRFVASRSVHILYSELNPPQRPVTNHSGSWLQAYATRLACRSRANTTTRRRWWCAAALPLGLTERHRFGTPRVLRTRSGRLGLRAGRLAYC